MENCDICTKIVDPLKDGHINIKSYKDGYYLSNKIICEEHATPILLHIMNEKLLNKYKPDKEKK